MKVKRLVAVPSHVRRQQRAGQTSSCFLALETARADTLATSEASVKQRTKAYVRLVSIRRV